MKHLYFNNPFACISIARLHHPPNRLFVLARSIQALKWGGETGDDCQRSSRWPQSSSCPAVEAWVALNCIFPGTEETMGFFTSRLMAAQSQEVSLQRIDWPSQIRAELHEPINGSDSSGPAGNLRSNHSACFHPLVLHFTVSLSPPRFFFSASRTLFFRSTVSGPEIMVMNRQC